MPIFIILLIIGFILLLTMLIKIDTISFGRVLMLAPNYCYVESFSTHSIVKCKRNRNLLVGEKVFIMRHGFTWYVV